MTKLKTAIVEAKGKTFNWQYKDKTNLLRWLNASYGTNYKIISFK